MTTALLYNLTNVYQPGAGHEGNKLKKPRNSLSDMLCLLEEFGRCMLMLDL